MQICEKHRKVAEWSDVGQDFWPFFFRFSTKRRLNRKSESTSVFFSQILAIFTKKFWILNNFEKILGSQKVVKIVRFSSNFDTKILEEKMRQISRQNLTQFFLTDLKIFFGNQSQKFFQISQKFFFDFWHKIFLIFDTKFSRFFFSNFSLKFFSQIFPRGHKNLDMPKNAA